MNKLPVMITVDSVADLPKDLAEKYNIRIHPYLVETDSAKFLDVIEVGAEHLQIYLSRNRYAISRTPARESYEEFFQKCSELAEEIIHLTMGSCAANGYERASDAAKKMGNVHVFDTENLSSAMGLIALRGAELAMAGNSTEEIISKMTSYKKRISSDFLVKDLECMYRTNRITKGVREMSYRFMFRPVLYMKKGEIAVKQIVFGVWRTVTKRYIRNLFFRTKNIDKRRVFITHVGLSEEDLNFILDEVSRYVQFEEVIITKATAAIACNCGKGAFGVLFGREVVTDIPADLTENAVTGLGGYFNQHILIKRESFTDLQLDDSEIVADDVEAIALPPENTGDAMTIVRGLDFLDYRSGLMYSAEDANLYLEILREFVKDDKSVALAEYLRRENWEDYRILVHALKGTAKIIGDMELSEAAKSLEFACKDQNYDFVWENHDVVMEQYSQLREKLNKAIGA